jgi:ribokinase
VPNETEAETITGKPVRSVDDARSCARYLVRQGLKRVIITLGENGALLAHDGGEEVIAAYRVGTKDTTGAGDAFVGSFAVFLGEGLSERDAIDRANLYAALSTTSVGTQKSFVTRQRFEEEWQGRAAGGPAPA